jgi:hypothetical protein
MPSVDRLPERDALYKVEDLVELRRHILRYARSVPPGGERNQHRQVAPVACQALQEPKLACRQYVGRLMTERIPARQLGLIRTPCPTGEDVCKTGLSAPALRPFL